MIIDSHLWLVSQTTRVVGLHVIGRLRRPAHVCWIHSLNRTAGCCFFRWDISPICLTVVSKLAVTVFIRLYYQTFWHKWPNFFGHFKNVRSTTEKKQSGCERRLSILLLLVSNLFSLDYEQCEFRTYRCSCSTFEFECLSCCPRRWFRYAANRFSNRKRSWTWESAPRQDCGWLSWKRDFRCVQGCLSSGLRSAGLIWRWRCDVAVWIGSSFARSTLSGAAT